ncbi:MAG: 50S ribosomal protein L30e [Methanomicrobiales archaeon]|nr:50S ribosomal protein L30e [Methanomicrobiales archaeon]
MDFNTSLRRAIKTGKVILGSNNTVTSISGGRAQLVVVAKNAPVDLTKFFTTENANKLYTFDGSSAQLGMACGKPFMVSALAVEEPGESDILDLVKV